MTDINDNTKDFINKLSQGNSVDAGEAFKDALRDKVASSLDNARKDIAANIFNGEAQSHSDPKPVIAEPGTFNTDGSISSTVNGGDGEAQIDLSQDGTANTMVGVDVNAGE
jgi:hypothetical protein